MDMGSETPEQFSLFDMPPDWRGEWQGMPDFEQEKQTPYACMNLRFEDEQALADFSKLIGQSLTEKTKSLWFPFKSHWREGEQPTWRIDES